VFLLTTAGWVAGQLVRRPVVWLWLIGVGAVWPAIVALTPLGATTAGQGDGAALYEIAFLALLLAALGASGLLLDARWFLEALPGKRRLLAQGAALTAAAGLFVLAGLAPAAVLRPSELDPTRLATGVALAHLHLGALCLVLLGTGLPRASVLVAVPLLAWVLPALAAGWGPVGAAVDHALGVAHHLRPADAGGEGDWREGASLWRGTPILGWAVLAILLARGPTHALRHPR